MSLEELSYNLRNALYDHLEYMQERDPVTKINLKVGCSHHPKAAYDLMCINRWNQPDELTRDSLEGDNYLPILAKEEVDLMSPRTRAAFERVRQVAFTIAGAAYLAGRYVRNGFTQFDLEEKEGSLDAIISDNASSWCSKEAFLVAFKVHHPVRSFTASIVGSAMGIALIPYALLQGYVYDPKEEENLF